MRRLILLLVLNAAHAQAGLSRLEALAMIETGNNDAAVGEAGEVSRYQIKPWIWRRYCQREGYQNHDLSGEVAEKYLADLEQVFRDRTGRDAGDFDVYVLWNAGPTYYARINFAQSRVHPIIRERAQRYVNLRQWKEVTGVKAAVSPATVAPAVPLPRQPAPSPAPKPAAETLWPSFVTAPPSGLQSPLFAILPLSAQPEAASISYKPLFAVGGLKPQ